MDTVGYGCEGCAGCANCGGEDTPEREKRRVAEREGGVPQALWVTGVQIREGEGSTESRLVDWPG